VGAIIRFSALSSARRSLVRLCQRIDYGQIIDLHVDKHGEPTLEPGPVVLADIKLDGQTLPRRELLLEDFELSAEFLRLMELLDRLRDGCIERIYVMAGLPKRISVRTAYREVTR